MAAYLAELQGVVAQLGPQARTRAPGSRRSRPAV